MTMPRVGEMLEAKDLLKARALYNTQSRDYRALIGAWILCMDLAGRPPVSSNSLGAEDETSAATRVADDAALRTQLNFALDLILALFS